MKQTYSWVPGSRFPGDPQAVGERLDAIRRRHNGRINRDMVVADATRAGSPLRKCFEWDDARAATTQRLETATLLLRCIAIVVTVRESDEPEIVKAFVSLPDPKKPGSIRPYYAVEDALRDPKLRQQLLLQARREAESWQHRYAKLDELGDIFAAMREVFTESVA